ncbi:MAG: hypothetical protein ABIP17_06355 [Ilumatobacteraceae bacterium]
MSERAGGLEHESVRAERHGDGVDEAELTEIGRAHLQRGLVEGNLVV